MTARLWLLGLSAVAAIVLALVWPIPVPAQSKCTTYEQGTQKFAKNMTEEGYRVASIHLTAEQTDEWYAALIRLGKADGEAPFHRLAFLLTTKLPGLVLVLTYNESGCVRTGFAMTSAEFNSITENYEAEFPGFEPVKYAPTEQA